MKNASIITAALALAALAPMAVARGPQREILPGIATTRPVPGVPLGLAGKRILFTDWSFIQPGDLDWVNAAGKSVYVNGDEEPGAARHVGINAPRGIRITARKPTVIGPLFRPHRCIIQEGSLYRGWTDNEYYESPDAIHWTKKANLKLDREEDGIQHIFVDPSAPAAERYKSVWPSSSLTLDQFRELARRRPDGWEPRALLHAAENGKVNCIRGSVSADGITWRTLPDPLVVEYSDTLNTACYDPVLRSYVLYTRYWAIRPFSDALKPDIRNSWTGAGRRAIGRSASPDFRSFPPSSLALEAPPTMLPSEVLYTNCYTTAPGAPDCRLMFPAVWNASIDDTTRLVVASSADGLNWHWIPGGDILSTAAPGAWNGGCIWAEPNLIELPNGDWALPYSAHNVPHKYPRGKRKGGLGYAVWPRGRLAGVEAAGEGEFTLMTVVAPGASIRVNAMAETGGEVRVAVLGDPARTLATSIPLKGDSFWTEATWRGQTGSGIRAGSPVTLRLHLTRATLYAIEFR